MLTHDPRGTRYVVVGTATDLETPVGVVLRFVEHDQLLLLYHLTPASLPGR